MYFFVLRRIVNAIFCFSCLWCRELAHDVRSPPRLLCVLSIRARTGRAACVCVFFSPVVWCMHALMASVLLSTLSFFFFLSARYFRRGLAAW